MKRLDHRKMKKSMSVLSYSTEEERKWWGELHRERLEKSDINKKFLSTGCTEEEFDFSSKISYISPFWHKKIK